MYKKVSFGLTALAVILMPAMASAHVVVTPAQIAIGDFQTFDVSVPNEKDSDVTQLKLVIPAGLGELSPTVKPGWQIDIEKSGSGDEATISSITWSGGSIPSGLRDDFTFRGQAPAKATELDWKAYQTYADGTTVTWDQKPDPKAGDDANGDVGPYSVTKVVNDLTPSTSNNNSTVKTDEADTTLPLVIGVIALVVAFAALLRPRPGRKP